MSENSNYMILSIAKSLTVAMAIWIYSINTIHIFAQTLGFASTLGIFVICEMEQKAGIKEKNGEEV